MACPFFLRRDVRHAQSNLYFASRWEISHLQNYHKKIIKFERNKNTKQNKMPYCWLRYGQIECCCERAIFGSKISDYHGQYGMNHATCQSERTELQCSRIWTTNGSDTPNPKPHQTKEKENDSIFNKKKRIQNIFIGWFENVGIIFSRRAMPFFCFSVPLKFGVADVKGAHPPNLWILFKGHANITSSLLSKPKSFGQ